MSVKVMGVVWDCEMKRDLKFVLLAYADHADHQGKNVFPAVSTIMKKTGYSERSVQRITRELVKTGYMNERGLSEYGTNLFDINLKKLGGAKIAPGAKNDAIVPKGGAKNDAQIAPKPSFNHKGKTKTKPSKKASRKRDARLDHPAVIAYRELARLTAPVAARDDLCKVGDVERWRDVVKTWIKKGWNPRNIDGMLDVYHNGFKQRDRANGAPNIYDVLDKLEAERER